MEEIFDYLLGNSESLILGIGMSITGLKGLDLYSEIGQAEARRENLDGYAEGHSQANSNDLLEYKDYQVSSTYHGLTELRGCLEEDNSGSVEESDNGFIAGAYDALEYSR